MPLQIPFDEYLKQEVARVKGQYYPVRSSILRQFLTKHAAYQALHPNPEDEFCFPDIGPNYEIISKYVKAFRDARRKGIDLSKEPSGLEEPLIVQRTMPDGYMILNGHHRWAAAIRAGESKLRVRVVNTTQAEDIRNMLEHSSSDVRVSLDLDEVVFCNGDDPNKEPPLYFPLNYCFREPVRKGIPALFHFLNEQKYDIWVYTSKYYSMDYIRALFGAHHVRLCGIVTGAGRKELGGSDGGKSLKQLAENRYRWTIMIDRTMVLQIHSGTHECNERMLTGPENEWSLEVMNVIREMTGNDKDS
ncbi:MAG: ParB-like nuclease domain-containing protein [Clostridia bacterium]|nr:ParB-like nuclease domain-containing protein [Clostridia bacterium]